MWHHTVRTGAGETRNNPSNSVLACRGFVRLSRIPVAHSCQDLVTGGTFPLQFRVPTETFVRQRFSSWLPICLNGCTKRFHVGRIPLRMPHRPHTLSKLLDKYMIRRGIRQMWHDVAERRQDEPVSRRGEDCFGDILDSEVLL